MASIPKYELPDYISLKNEPELKADINKLNADVRKWSFQTKNMMAQNVRMLTNSSKTDYIRKINWQRLAPNIRPRTIVKDGMAERVTMNYPAHGYFISVGSGRGHHKKTNPRRIINWYNDILESQVENLGDIVQAHISTLTVRVTNI